MEPLVEIRNLNFSFAPTHAKAYSPCSLRTDSDASAAKATSRDILCGISLSIGPGQRIVLVGANGAGKSTLLSILAGKHLAAYEAVLIDKRDAFRDTTLNLSRTYASSQWGQRSVAFASSAVSYSADISVSEMMTQLQQQFSERRDTLLKILRIDPAWRVPCLSQGQRCRVHLFLALLRPCKLILLDEILASLDIISRENILQYLKWESETNNAIVILATHVFDAMDSWATDVMYLNNGKIGFYGSMDICVQTAETEHNIENISLYRIVEKWLRKEIVTNEYMDEYKHDPASLSNAQNRAGGYAAGRLGNYKVET